MFEDTLVQQPDVGLAGLASLERELLVRTPEAVEWATIACDGRNSADSWLRQLVAENKMKNGKPFTHPVSSEDLTLSTVKRLKFGRVPQDTRDSLRQNDYFAVYASGFPALASAHVHSLVQKKVEMLEDVRNSQALAVSSQNKGAAAVALMKLAPKIAQSLAATKVAEPWRVKAVAEESKGLEAGVLLCCNDKCNQLRKLGKCPKTQKPWLACSKECFKAQESMDMMREQQRVEESSQVNNPYVDDGADVRVRYQDVVALVDLSPEGEGMRNNALQMMEQRRELPEPLLSWLEDSIAAQATRLAALEVDGSPGVTMAGGRPVTEEEYPTQALPTKKRKMSALAHSLHESGIYTTSSPSQAKVQARVRAGIALKAEAKAVGAQGVAARAMGMGGRSVDSICRLQQWRKRLPSVSRSL
jgi:hypothetical protein